MPDRAAVRPGRRRRRSAIPSRRCFTIVDLMMDGSPLFVSLERGGASFLLFIRRAYQQLCNTLELLYVRQHYISIEALRQANRAVVNKILALRDPRLWGEDYACASDGSRFASWSQNLTHSPRFSGNALSPSQLS